MRVIEFLGRLDMTRDLRAILGTGLVADAVGIVIVAAGFAISATAGLLAIVPAAALALVVWFGLLIRRVSG